MTPRAVQLALRRERLVSRSRELRRCVVLHAQDLQPALSWVDRIQDAVFWLRGNPFAATAGTLLLSLWRPRRAAGFGMRVWSAWKLIQRLRGAEGDVSARRR